MSETSDRKGLAAKVGGCLSGCAALAFLVVSGIATGVGAAFELVQPQHKAQAQVADVSCDLAWWRTLWGSAHYRITCTADRDREISQFKLLSGPRGVTLVESVEDWGQRPWEDQRPMAGETIELERGRTWKYDGWMSLGMPWLGPDATVKLSLEVDPGDVPLVIEAPE